MKRSITNKIILSYLIIISVSLTFVGIVFNITAKRFMENQARAVLLNDAAAIAELFNKSRGKSAVTEENIKQLLRERLKQRKALEGIESSWAIITNGNRILFPRNSKEVEELENHILPLMKYNPASDENRKMKFSYKGNEYLAVAFPLNLKNMPRAKGDIVLYTPVGAVNKLSRNFLFVLIVSLLLTGIVTIVFGIIFARSIAKPIIKLKNRAESLSKRDFDSSVEIKTGDELEELAFTLEKMALELKEYDVAQKSFIQNASHELKTPLMSIQGYAEGIKDGVFEDNEKALQIIADESTRLKGIVEELVYLSKLETMEDFYKFEAESINKVIEKSVEKVNSLAMKNNIRINLILYKDQMIKMDSDKITQAFINLLSNCLRYAQNEINIVTSNNGKVFEIRICDDGEGFDEIEIKNIFKRFYKGKKGNTGLGLSITKVIIERHKGFIEATNSKKGGAEFIIRFEL